MVNKHFIVVVGAGGSRDLGHDPVPLMDGWSQSIFESLTDAGLPPSQWGLDEAMSGQEFEETLGRFLEMQRLVKRARTLLPQYDRVGQPDFNKYTAPWLKTAAEYGDKAIEVIRENLVTSFGSGVVNPTKAAGAYESLFTVLEDHKVNLNNVVLSTTNYDRAIEIGLSTLGRTTDDGFAPPGPEQAPELRPDRLVDRHYGQPIVPILHLHGAVNWYVNDAGIVMKQFDNVPYNPTLGTPALILPDPDKDPASDPVIGRLWSEFQKAVEEASHILIIGHGLNDRALVRTIASRNRAVGWATPNASKQADQLETLLPGATPIDIRFGKSGSLRPLNSWLKEVVP